MSKKNYVVYKHTNIQNGKIYVGLTSMTPEERWRSGKGYHSGSYFRNAIDKYGWDGFEHTIIKDNLTKKEASYWEKYYIDYYKSTNRLYGYNTSSGGECGGHPQTEETKKKIGENGFHYGMQGKTHSDETKQKMSESRMGHIVTDQTKEKMKKSALKDRGRLFLCVELNKIFDNLTDAHFQTGCHKSAIVSCCQGKQKQSKGFHWEYVN